MKHIDGTLPELDRELVLFDDNGKLMSVNERLENLYRVLHALKHDAFEIRSHFEHLSTSDMAKRDRQEMFRLGQDMELVHDIANNTRERIRLIVQNNCTTD